jgi:predicted RNA binding protein YcfA (HicA-like mRNA interferase family)/predicted RNase H-like HicB family nuclease
MQEFASISHHSRLAEAVFVKVSEAIKPLQDDGWEWVAGKGGHRQFKHPAKPGRVTVAGKPSADLHPKTAASNPSTGRPPTMTDFAELAQRYLILIEGGPPSNYSAWSPDLPGCAATGDTLEQVEHEMRAAIALHLAGVAEDGGPLPEPSGPGVYIERTSPAAA